MAGDRQRAAAGEPDRLLAASGVVVDREAGGTAAQGLRREAQGQGAGRARSECVAAAVADDLVVTQIGAAQREAADHQWGSASVGEGERLGGATGAERLAAKREAAGAGQ